jgi:hypothetical protein
MTAEHDRLDEAREQAASWMQWEPYLSERQWGTVREDYSEGGDAWNYLRASPLLETLFGPEPKGDHGAAPGAPGAISFRGDLGLVAVAVGELHRSYQELPIQLLCGLAIQTRALGSVSPQANRSQLLPTTADVRSQRAFAIRLTTQPKSRERSPESAACVWFRLGSPGLHEPEDHAEVGNSIFGHRNR